MPVPQQVRVADDVQSNPFVQPARILDVHARAMICVLRRGSVEQIHVIETASGVAISVRHVGRSIHSNVFPKSVPLSVAIQDRRGSGWRRRRIPANEGIPAAKRPICALTAPEPRFSVRCNQREIGRT